MRVISWFHSCSLRRPDLIFSPSISQTFCANRESGLSGLSSGYPALDKVTSGWQNSDLIIIAARRDQFACEILLGQNARVPFDIGRRCHTRRQVGDEHRTASRLSAVARVLQQRFFIDTITIQPA